MGGQGGKVVLAMIGGAATKDAVMILDGIEGRKVTTMKMWH